MNAKHTIHECHGNEFLIKGFSVSQSTEIQPVREILFLADHVITWDHGHLLIMHINYLLQGLMLKILADMSSSDTATVSESLILGLSPYSHLSILTWTWIFGVYLGLP